MRFQICAYMGKMQSDNIEGRFSHVRQLSGANYYISMRQLHESERKLRTISLLKYSNIAVPEIMKAAKTNSGPTNAITSTAESIQAELLFNVCPNENDAAIIFMFVATAADQWPRPIDAMPARKPQLKRLMSFCHLWKKVFHLMP